MTVAVSLTDIITLAHTTRNAVNHWRAQGYISTKWRRAMPRGTSRSFTRENACEIVFMACLIEIGLLPDEAATVTGQWMTSLADPSRYRIKLNVVLSHPKIPALVVGRRELFMDSIVEVVDALFAASAP